MVILIIVCLIIWVFALSAMAGTYSANKYCLERTQKRIEDRINAKADKDKKTEIYCGDEETAHFLIDAIGQLKIKAECEIFTVDGEYFVQVKI